MPAIYDFPPPTDASNKATINGGCSLYGTVQNDFEAAVSIREAQNRRGLQLNPLQIAQVMDKANTNSLRTGPCKPLVIFCTRARSCRGFVK